MKLKIEFDLDNAAFDGGSFGYAISAVLRDVASRYAGATRPNKNCRGVRLPVCDANGNRIGTRYFTKR